MAQIVGGACWSHVVLLAVVLSVAGCGGGDGKAPSGPTSSGGLTTTGEVKLTDLGVKPPGTVVAGVPVGVEFTATAAPAETVVGAFALVISRGLALQAGQGGIDELLASAQIGQRDVIGTLLRIVLTFSVPEGRRKFAFAIGRKTGSAERRAGTRVSGAQTVGGFDIISDVIEFVIKATPRPGTIVIAVGSSGGSFSPNAGPVPLTRLRISGPDSFGPLTVPVGDEQALSAPPGDYTAEGGMLYIATCPATAFRVESGETTLLEFDQQPKVGSTILPCTVKVVEP